MFDRKAHWQNVYQEKSPLDVSWYQKEPKLSLELIHRTGVSVDEPIIDVGGGASVLVDFLCKDGFTNLSVLDISENALADAKNRLGDLAKNIEWVESDVTEFNSSHKFTLWHDRAVFHFLTDESDRRKYVNALTQSLKAGGHLIIAAFAIGGPNKCSGLEIVQYDSSKLKAELGEKFELLEERNEIHITPANKEQKFMYFRFIRKLVNKKT
ncbi:MAG TPA: class I SAM-dependent methyltransferase [Kiritimatiellia bacterium]|nr:class I SAM-dependent methyltransferase [Saprospiraceae bacterium]HMP00775.1 class I SAM-dependent methyltransferase [Kiritimatiellia bacterium]